jgi:WD40 repeat protein
MIRIWDAATGKEIRQFKGPGTQISALAFAPNERALISGSDDGAVARWDPDSGQKKWQTKQIGEVRTLAFSPDGKAVAVGGGPEYGWRRGQQNEPFLILLDPTAGQKLREASVGRDSVASLGFSKDGRVMAAGLGGTIRVLDAVSFKARSASNGHESWISSVTVSENGKLAATAGGDGAIILWDLPSGTEQHRLKGHLGEARAVQFVAGGKLLASASNDQTVRLWHQATGVEALRLEGSPEGTMYSLAVAPDGKTIAAGDYSDGTIVLWSAATGERLQALKLGAQRGQAIMCLTFSPDGAMLAAGETNLNAKGEAPPKARILLWDAKTGKKVREFPAHADAVNSSAFSPDGHTLASTGWQDKVIGLWDVGTGKGLLDLPCGTGNGVVAYSPDGKILAWGSSAGEVLLWETASKQWRRKFAGHSAFVHALAFSPDGKLLVSGSMDTTALVWDVIGLASDAAIPPALSTDNLGSLWKSLADSDAEKAGQAIRYLTADPKRAVPFIAERLREPPAGEHQTIANLIAELDSDTFKVRQAAEAGLAALGKLAEPGLRDALTRQPSLEVRRRLEKLLAQRETVALPPPALQTVRAMEVLEHIGSAEARHALEKPTRAGRQSYFAQEARAALERLRRR